MTTSPVELTVAADASARLRILHYVPAVRLEQGGVVRAVLDWCTVFARHGHTVSLVVYQDKDLPRDWLDSRPGTPRAHLVRAPARPFKLLGVGAMRKIRELLCETDILHLHGPWLDGNRQIAKLAMRLGVPYVLSTHGMLDDWSMSQRPFKKRMYMSLFGRELLNGASAVHCTAEEELSQAKKWFDNPRTIVLPYLVDLSLFEKLPGPDLALSLLPATVRHRPKLLFLSRLHEQKGVDILIRAAGLMRDADGESVALLAGTGDPIYESYLRGLVAELNLRDRVLFLGLITGDQKLSMYQAADLFVLPTQHENFGLVLIEAMACGIPVLTTKGTDIWREIEAAGAVISDSTPSAFAENIERLMSNPTERTQRGKRGQEWVHVSLAVESLSRKYEAVYQGLLRS